MFKAVAFNPAFFFVVAAIINIGELLSGYVKNPKLFLTINFFIKVIPILSLIYSPLHMRDIYAGLLYFVIYCIWILLNGQDLLKIRTPITDFIKDKFL